MKRLSFTSQAEQDLVDIYDYIADDNPRAAILVMNQLEKRCKSLRLQPKVGRERNYIAPGLRSITESHYVIFYRLMPDEIQVIRVLHGARDVERLLE
ncbi:MAG: type II toxin-antitoxin system RelE/ParE family toxin [Blastocatellia bacterium AA13]|nr:MAG: type II toxin-antitoxin system RelE/ParE family toxin [Blastocatellia bacterium AA13]